MVDFKKSIKMITVEKIKEQKKLKSSSSSKWSGRFNSLHELQLVSRMKKDEIFLIFLIKEQILNINSQLFIGMAV